MKDQKRLPSPHAVSSVFVLLFVLLLMIEGVLLVAGFVPGFVTNLQKDSQHESFENTGKVLAAEDTTPLYVLKVDVSSIFQQKADFLDAVAIKKTLQVDGTANLFGGVDTNNTDIDAGTGSVTASNLVYSLLAGANITISGDPQNPTISAEGDITTIQGLSGALTLTSGSGIGISGLTIDNTGVLSLSGQTGAVTLGAGSGITVSGTTITNSDLGSSQNIFKEIIVGGSSIFAGSNNDVLTFTAGSGITLTPDISGKNITITSNASGTLSGLTQYGVLYATSPNDATSLAPGTSGYVLKSNGAGAAPEWVAPGTFLGAVAFDTISSGANTSAAMVVGSGASLGYTGTGTINASSLLGSTWAAPGSIGSSVANTGAFTTLTATTLNGLTVTNTGSNTLTIANGKSLSVSNSLTLVGTDSTTFTFPATSGTVVTTDLIQTLTNKTIAAGSNTITGLTNANLSGSAGITNANLQNSSLTVTAGTGLSGGGSVSLGGSVALANAGVTGATGGTGISIDQSTGNITIANSGVTSLTGTANRVSVSGVTGAVTLNLPQDIHSGATPTFSGLTLSAFTNNGGILYTNGSGTVTQTSVGSNGQCLTSSGGGAPAWAACSDSDESYWQLANGSLSPSNSTLDLLIGGTATTSAKFAFTNVSGSGTPTASISGSVAGNAVSLTGDGVLATSNNRSLLLNPNGGNVGIGLPDPQSALAVNGGIRSYLGSNYVLLSHDGSNGALESSAGNLVFTAAGNRFDFASSGHAMFLTLGSDDSITWNYEDSQTNLYRDALGTLQTDSTLNIFGGDHSGGKAALIVDQVGANTNDIFTASASGATRFSIRNNGTIQINNLANCDTIDTDANGVLTCGTDGGATYTAGNDLDLTGNTFSLETTLDFVDTINLAGTGTLNGVDVIDGTTETTIENAIDTLANLTSVTIAGDTITDFTGTGLQMTGNALTTTLGTSISNAELDNDTIDFDKIADNLTLDATTTIANGNFNFVLGTNAGTGNVVVSPNAGGQAALIVNKQGDNDIFTASASGSTRFVVTNAGDLRMAAGQTIDTLNNGTLGIGTANATTLSLGRSGQSIALGGYNNCGMLTTTGTTLTCSSAPSPGTNYWQMNNGTVSPFSNTLDLLVGGTATTSAKFAFINANTGTPTASISANTANNALYLSGNGIIGTTNKQTLTLGSPSTGNIVLNGFGSGVLHANSSGVLSSSAIVNADLAAGIFTNITGVGTLTAGTWNATAIGAQYGGTGLNTAASTGVPSISGGTWSVNAQLPLSLGGTNANLTASNGGIVYSNASALAILAANANSGLALVSGGAGAPSWFSPTTGNVIFAGTNGALSQNNNFFFDTTNSRLGLGTTSTLATLDIRGQNGTLPIASFSGTTARAGLIVDNNGLGDLFTASKSGATKFTVLNNGNVRMNNYATAGGIFYGQADGTLALSAAGSGGQCLLSGGSGAPTWGACGGGSVDSWALQSGLLYNGNLTTDIALGGNSSASAKFKVSPSGTTATASVAGQTSHAALVVDQNGVGDIFTASKSGTTKFTIRNSGVVVIGDATNGITFDPLNGGPTYAGGARPAKTISLQPEYPGAVLTAFYGAGTDTNITGFMTSDIETSGTNNLRSYYEWERTTDATQHFYTVAVRVRLPKDFSAWADTNAIQVDYRTESATNTVSDLDVRVYLESDSTLASTDAESLNNASTSWATISLDDSALGEVDAADETAVIYLRMGSASSNYVRVGEIKLNYLSRF